MESGFSCIPTAVKTNSKLLRAFELGKIPLDELFNNVLGGTFGAEEQSWRDSISVIPASLRQQFLKFVRASLTSVDFMPVPGVVFPPPASSEEIQTIKKERRPRYLRLFQVIEDVCTATASGMDQHPSAS